MTQMGDGLTHTEATEGTEWFTHENGGNGFHTGRTVETAKHVVLMDCKMSALAKDHR